MNGLSREHFINTIRQTAEWDLIVVGGGATGLGVAVDGASRGLKTLLLEKDDFAKGTSSRSTKLVHGGVRYLAQGNISLVYTALKERGILLRNAPHLVRRQSFIIPCYSTFEILKYGLGLKLYDQLAGRLSFGRSGYLNVDETLQRLPDLKRKNLKGAIEYFDGQFDDARLAITLAQSAASEGASLLNYFRVTGLLKTNGKISGVTATDTHTGESYSLHCKTVINATGIFSAELTAMDDPADMQLHIAVSQGAHIVLPANFFHGTSALMIPKTKDGRLLFVVPWHDHLLVGTTDTPVSNHSNEPAALHEEVDFIMETLSPFLQRVPSKNDILSVFAGLRPLAIARNSKKATKEISRDHQVFVSESGLISITGGKWTTYRKMAADTVDVAIKNTNIVARPGITALLKLHGWSTENNNKWWSVYGSDAKKIFAIIREVPEYGKELVAGHRYVQAQVIWAVRNEMALTIEDVLARRLRLLFLDARAAIKAAPIVAKLMSEELGHNDQWEREQLRAFNSLANRYLVTG